MANYATLKAAIQAVIKQNGNKEITGTLLQQALLSIINSLGDGFQYVGVANPQTDPGTPDQRVFWVIGPGDYSNFGTAFTIGKAEIGFVAYNGTWNLLRLPLSALEKQVDATKASLNYLGVAQYENGYYLGTDGQPINSSNTATTEFVPVSPGDQILVSGRINAGVTVAGYDSNKNFVGALLGNNVQYELESVIIPSGVSFVRACSVVGLSGYKDPGLYYGPIVSALSKDAYLKNQTENPFINRGGYINPNGGITAFGDFDFRYSDFIPVTSGQLFYFRGFVSTVGLCIAGYSSNTESSFVQSLLAGKTEGYTEMQAVVIPSGINYIRVCSSFGIISGYQWAGFLYSNGETDAKNTDLILDICQLIMSVKELGQQSTPLLSGKKVVFFGDSITYQGGYIEEFCRLSGAIGYNRGVGGTTIAQVPDTLAWPASLTKRVDLPADETVNAQGAAIGLPSAPDMVVMFAGVNDWGRMLKSNFEPTRTGDGTDPERYITGCRFGDFTVEDKTTFCGGVRYVLRRLKTKYPDIPILVMLPLHTYAPTAYKNWCELIYANAADESSNIEIVKTNDDDKSFYDLRNAIRNIAQEYGMPVIDTFNVGFSAILASDKSQYYWEGLHPSALGHKLLGQFVYTEMKKMMLNRE